MAISEGSSLEVGEACLEAEFRSVVQCVAFLYGEATVNQEEMRKLILRAITANSVKHNVMRHAGSTLEDHTMFLDQKDFYCSRAQVLKSAQSAHHYRDSAL